MTFGVGSILSTMEYLQLSDRHSPPPNITNPAEPSDDASYSYKNPEPESLIPQTHPGHNGSFMLTPAGLASDTKTFLSNETCRLQPCSSNSTLVEQISFNIHSSSMSLSDWSCRAREKTGHTANATHTLVRYNSEPLLRIPSPDLEGESYPKTLNSPLDESVFSSFESNQYDISQPQPNSSDSMVTSSEPFGMNPSSTVIIQIDRNNVSQEVGRATPCPNEDGFGSVVVRTFDNCVTPKQNSKQKLWRPLPLKKKREQVCSNRIAFVGRGGGGFIPSPSARKSKSSSSRAGAVAQASLKTVHGFKISKSYNNSLYIKRKGMSPSSPAHNIAIQPESIARETRLLGDRKCYSADMLYMEPLQEDSIEFDAERSSQTAINNNNRKQTRQGTRSDRNKLASILKRMDEHSLSSVLESLKI